MNALQLIPVITIKIYHVREIKVITAAPKEGEAFWAAPITDFYHIMTHNIPYLWNNMQNIVHNVKGPPMMSPPRIQADGFGYFKT